MDSERFDSVVRVLSSGASRRGVLGLLAGAAGLALGEAAARKRKRRKRAQRVRAEAKADKVTVCHATSDASNPYEVITISVNGWRNGHSRHEGDSLRGDCCVDAECADLDDRCHVGECEVAGTGTERESTCASVLREECDCTEWVISGGPNPTDPLFADDDLSIERNGDLILDNQGCLASTIPPVVFTAAVGDTLHVVATDCAFCRSLSPLWLHCPGGLSRELFPGLDDGCDANRPTGIFFNQTFTVEL